MNRQARNAGLVFVLFGLPACFEIDLFGPCAAYPGSPCLPGDHYCSGDYYCAVGGVCTKPCFAPSDCESRCEEDDDCGEADDDGTREGYCQAGLCVCRSPGCAFDTAKLMVCLDGFCQPPCIQSGECAYDPYAPRYEAPPPNEEGP